MHTRNLGKANSHVALYVTTERDILAALSRVGESGDVIVCASKSHTPEKCRLTAIGKQAPSEAVVANNDEVSHDTRNFVHISYLEKEECTVHEPCLSSSLPPPAAERRIRKTSKIHAI